MSTIVFVGQKIPIKHLLRETNYRYQPDSSIKEKIIADLVKHIGSPIPENIIIDIDIRIDLKEFDLDNLKTLIKNNDTKNT